MSVVSDVRTQNVIEGHDSRSGDNNASVCSGYYQWSSTSAHIASPPSSQNCHIPSTQQTTNSNNLPQKERETFFFFFYF